MLKKTIAYTDFDGIQREESFYFNLTKTELTEMELSATGGLTKMIEKIVETQDGARILTVFKELILKAYGEKSKGVQDTLAYRALEKIARIYLLDEKFKNLPPDERKKRRQSTVKPRVDAFFAWVKQHQNDPLPKSKTGEGFTYCLNNEKYLRMFLDNGLIPIDNSASERAIRPFTIGRKNWQLIDTVNGAKASAIIYSIVETAKANNLKPYEYLKHLLTEIPQRLDQKASECSLDDLLPWADTIPDCCRLKTK